MPSHDASLQLMSPFLTCSMKDNAAAFATSYAAAASMLSAIAGKLVALAYARASGMGGASASVETTVAEATCGDDAVNRYTDNAAASAIIAVF